MDKKKFINTQRYFISGDSTKLTRSPLFSALKTPVFSAQLLIQLSPNSLESSRVG